jgi:ABC-type multidrug transport system ATPase subunit
VVDKGDGLLAFGHRSMKQAVARRPDSSQDPEFRGDSAQVAVTRLCRAFKRRGDVFSDLSFVAHRGDRIALTGPNGSGKSTLLRCLAGSMKPTDGTIDILGHPAGSAEARDLVGMSLSQERSFFLRLTGEQNLVYFASLRRSLPASPKHHVSALLEELEAWPIARQRVDRCSTGMIQQLTFARALLGDPDVLLLDEPTRSLDKDAIERLWAALDRRQHCILIIATHRDEDVGRCTRRIALG